jgi:hypothetical protein
MTKDRSVVKLPFKDYIKEITERPEQKLYARAIPDDFNVITERLGRYCDMTRHQFHRFIDAVA